MLKTEIYDAAEELGEHEHLQLVTALWRSHVAKYGDPRPRRTWHARNRWVDIVAAALLSAALACFMSSCTSVVEQTSTASDGTITVTKRTFKLDGGVLGGIMGVHGSAGTYTVPTVTRTK